MVGKRGTGAPGSQTLPLMEKHPFVLPLIPPQHCPALCASRRICATTNQTLKQTPSCVKNEIHSPFVEWETAGAVPARVPCLGSPSGTSADCTPAFGGHSGLP